MAMSDFEVLDSSFGGCIKASAKVEKLYEGCRWAEGPAYFPAMRSLVWSDIPNDRMMRFDEATGITGVFRQPAGYSNGNTVDRQGRLVSCEHGNRRITRTEHDGSITVLADQFEGGRFNSPNDVVVKSDGSIWFTDPPYGNRAITSTGSALTMARSRSSPTTSTSRTDSPSRPTSRSW
jgi:gluconolactonase